MNSPNQSCARGMLRDAKRSDGLMSACGNEESTKLLTRLLNSRVSATICHPLQGYPHDAADPNQANQGPIARSPADGLPVIAIRMQEGQHDWPTPATSGAPIHSIPPSSAPPKGMIVV